MRDMLPFAPSTFMMIVGVIEAAVGLMILTRFTRLGAYVAMVWLVLISINLMMAGILDVAVRDLVMAVGAYSLGTLAGLERGWRGCRGRAREPQLLKSHANPLH
jgi:hypothetical protein